MSQDCKRAFVHAKHAYCIASTGLVLTVLVPVRTRLIQARHYWLTSTWTLLAKQYWAPSEFHNRCGTTPVLPDTGSALTMSTAPVLAEYGDDNAQYWLSSTV